MLLEEAPPLRSYQLEGIERLGKIISSWSAALLADEMGLGKSREAIELAKEAINSRASTASSASSASLASSAASIIIVCPKIVVPHWWSQLERWGAIEIERHPRRKGIAWRGRVGKGKEEGFEGFPAPPSEWRVYSYEGFASAVAAKGAEPKSKTAEWVGLPSSCYLFILDELHSLQSEGSRRSKAVRVVLGEEKGSKSPWPQRPAVIGLSGTPIPTRPRDLWNPLVSFFGERRLRKLGIPASFFRFTQKFSAGYWKAVEGLDKAVWDSSGASNQEELGKLLAPIMVRRTKAEVALELPAMIRTIVDVEMPDKASRAVREALIAEGEIDWSSAPKLAISRMLSGLESYKLDAAVELATDLREQGHRPLLLTTRVASAQQLGERLLCPWVSGETEPNVEIRREKLLAAEQASIDPSLPGVATLQCLGVGVDLIEFDCVIFVGLDWQPFKLQQAEARISRLGQQRGTSSFFLIAEGTLDEVVREKVISRLDDFGKIFGGEEEANMASSLRGGSEEDLIAALVAAARE